MLHTMHGDFRTYIPVNDIHRIHLPYRGGESYADAKRRQAREASEELKRWCAHAITLTPEVEERLQNAVGSRTWSNLAIALQCYALPNSLFTEIAQTAIAFNSSKIQYDLVQRISDRLERLRQAIVSGTNAIRNGQTTATFSWYNTDLQFTDLTQSDLDELKQSLVELTNTIPEILSQSPYFYVWVVAAQLTTSTDTLTNLAYKCARLKENLGRRNQLAEAIIKSPVFDDQATFGLLQTPMQTWEDTTVPWRIWVPALEKRKLNHEIVNSVRNFITYARNGEYYQSFDGWFLAPEYFKLYSDALKRMEAITEGWAKRHQL